MTFRRLTVPCDVGTTPVSRRDFLRLSVSEGRRVLELSCERLFMRYHDACSEAGRRQVSNHEDVPGVDDRPTGFQTPSPDALFAVLEQELAGADELRVLEREWLGNAQFARELGTRVEAFVKRGGHVATPLPSIGGQGA